MRMGLDVKVYGNIKLAEKEEDDVDFVAYVIDDRWQYKIKNLKLGESYYGDCICNGVSYPYSYHNRFREKLILLIGKPELLDADGKIKWKQLSPEIPFYDFIDFADNEGCLDWEISEKIYKDFDRYKKKAKVEFSESAYSYYKVWMRTFKIASENQGVVKFY